MLGHVQHGRESTPRRLAPQGARVRLRPVGEESRLNWAKVATARGPVVIPWATRDELLERLQAVRGSAAVIAAFREVGATRPVELDAAGKSLLLEVLSRWLDEDGGGDVAPGVAELRRDLL